MPPDAQVPDSQATTDTLLLADRYHLLDKLGAGGMGTVCRARDTKLNRQVAVKLLPPGSVHDAAAVARFSREARALAHLSHPGIIQAYDSGQHGAQHFLVMELVKGRSLADELAGKGALTLTAPPTTFIRRRWRWSTPIGTGLSTAMSSRPTCW